MFIIKLMTYLFDQILICLYFDFFSNISTIFQLFREWLPFVYPSKDYLAKGILPTVTHNAAIFLLLFGIITKVLK